MKLSEYKALQMRDPDFREAYEKDAKQRSDVQRRINESMKNPAFKELWESDDFIDPLDIPEEDLREYLWEDDD